jgi:hypothetical protein
MDYMEKNKLIFQGGICKSIRSLGASIIALTKYWSMINGDDYQINLHKILPANINLLPVQIRDAIVDSELSEEEV